MKKFGGRILFRNVCFFVIFSFFVLAVAGCSGASSVDGGLNPVETLVLDDEYAATLNVEEHEIFALDVIRPVAKGYRISGAFFDPSILRMERYLEYEEDGEPRARYLFAGLAGGACDVLVRMVPDGGGEMEVYRQVTVTVGRAKGWFD